MMAVNLTGVFLTFRDGLNQLPGLGTADRRRLHRRAEGLCQGRALCGGQTWRDRHGAQPCAGNRAQARHGERDLPRLSRHADDRTLHPVIAEKTGKTQAEARAALEGMSARKTACSSRRKSPQRHSGCAARGRKASTARPSPFRGARYERSVQTPPEDLDPSAGRHPQRAKSDLREFLRLRHDTTLPRFDVMAALWRRRDGVTMSELSRMLLVSNGNATAVVDRLEKDGLVRRTPVGNRPPHRLCRADR